MNFKKSILVVIMAIVSIALAISVIAKHITNEKSLLVFPKGSTYDKEWKKVDSLARKGLTKSALEVINGIYKKAKADDNAPQFVKAIIHRMKFEQYMEEYSLVKAITDLEKEVAEAKYPVQPILQSMLAETYWNYYENNRWKFYNRTQTTEFKNEDITTWDLKTIVDKTIKNYQASLMMEDSLKRTSINVFEDVLISKKEGRQYRPTLYDFLAHRAVDFYMNEEPDITKPAYKFELNSDSYFWDAKAFSKLNIENKDSLSLKYYAIKILRDLTAFHLDDSYAFYIGKDANAEAALIDVDLKRLAFVRSKSVSEYKDSLYLNAIQKLEKQYNTNPASSEVSYMIASYYHERAGKNSSKNSEQFLSTGQAGKWDNKTALEICEQTIKKFPAAGGAQNCVVLKEKIRSRSLDFKVEKINEPNQPHRALVSFKNVQKVYIRIAKMDIDKYNKVVERYYGEELIKEYLKLTPVTTFSTDLPDDGDYHLHTTEIKLPELNYGHYIVLIGTDAAFSYQKNAIAYAATWMSNISYVNRKMNDGTETFFVQHRVTGEPLKNVSAQLFYEKYNYSLRKYQYVKGQKYTTDENGFFTVPPANDYRNYNVEFTYAASASETDHLQIDNAIYQYRSYKEEKYKYPKTFFFLDRGIYRPGQTVYFKGIMINTDGETNEILPNYATTVELYDVNYQKVADLKLTTNEYGTFNGTFTAPMGVLNGNMRIQNESGQIYFSVEEYKRPKFDVTFKPVKGSYRLNENIKVNGIAKAFSGASIDGAEVKYRVVRNASFPMWWYWWRGYTPNSPQMEITNGVTTTNDTGAFFVDFKAIPDLSVAKSYKPTYTYTVYADVTDINGETHSSQTYVSAAYTAMNLRVNIPDMLEKENASSFIISSTNMSGEFENAQGKVEIYKLKQPDKTYRERAWEAPDKPILSKEEFEKAFPNDEYKDENSIYKWAKGQMVYQKLFTNKINSKNKYDSLIISNLPAWQQGAYVMEAISKDAYGEEVKDIKYFTVYSNKATVVPGNEINWFNHLTGSKSLEPGEKAQFVIGSKEQNIKVFYEIEHKGEIVKKEFITLNNEQRLIEIPVEEKHRGNFAFHYVFVKNNRMYTRNGVITVPYTNKQLDISFETFRNKLLPGQQEEWKIKIKDKKGDKMAAEMVATLYDASLDEFRANYWDFNIYNNYYSSLNWDANRAFGNADANLFSREWNTHSKGYYRDYDRLNWFGYGYSSYARRGDYKYDYYDEDSYGATGAALEEVTVNTVVVSKNGGKDRESKNRDKKESAKAMAYDSLEPDAAEGYGMIAAKPAYALAGKALEDGKMQDLSNVAARSNFAETAFFYPALQTDSEANVIIKFTIPESLTKWKMMGFAHTKDLKFGQIQETVITQKELMVVPNAPRFFRENDKIEFISKITNLSDKDLLGTAHLFLYDAITMKDITSQIIPNDVLIRFKVNKGLSTNVSWTFNIPEGIGAITYKVVAQAGNYTDGEEMAVPVLTNRMLVTETLPLPIRGNQTKNFRFEKFISQNGGSTTLRNHKVTLEFTSNPAWYAVQSLPYLMEYPYECAEQTFSRFYANSIASHIANSSPKIKAVFNSWKTQSPDALLSNLEKNQELKSLMLEETPWVLDAKDETERKKRVALLFDLNKMSNELSVALKKLKKMQTSNGGFPWFEGMPDDRYITQHIVTGMGHLDHLGVKNVREEKSTWSMVKEAVKYLDNRIREDYEYILKYDKENIDKNHLGYSQIQYLYARSYFKDISIDNRNQKAFDYYKAQAKKYWLDNSRYMQGMIALALHRYDDNLPAGKAGVTPQDIIKSLKENSLNNEEMGMYWKENYSGYYWYQAPIETQALLIEAFDEVANDKKSVEDMKVWLLKSKQTQDWKTTKATTEAVYALLLRGTDWLATESNVEITVGDMKVDPKQLDIKQEAGTGYFKTSWSGSDIKPKMGEITIEKKSSPHVGGQEGGGVSWGAMYWQYFEQLDKITPAKTPLSLKKQLFVQKNTDAGPVIEPITEKRNLKVGDKIKVRIELRVDRDMEYVQMKDMRASGFEPTNVISQYKWQDGLGYYESTRDAATNFFFSYLPKGTYVFEYPMVVTHNGNFSNGITSIQCMYAPEFASHSEGIRVKIGK